MFSLSNTLYDRRIVNTSFVQQGEAETQCRRERKDLPEQRSRETQGGEDGTSEGEVWHKRATLGEA